MRNHTLFLLFVCLSVFMASPAKAGLDSELNGMFNDMINVTPGESYETQRRGVITGGSLSMRNKLVRPNLISFVPPDIKGGCGGIDLFGGSFSYINSAQFTQLMRSIAQAAVGYAFQLAIEGMCPTCAQIISKLQKDVATLNSLMRNSCEAAQNLVNATGLRAWRDKEVFEAGGLTAQHGYLEDFFKAKEGTTDSPAKVMIAHGAVNEITGNIVYEALQASNAASWYASNDEQMKMVMMSLTGTIIRNVKNDNSDAQYDTRPALLSIRDFIEGGQVTIYKCESSKCLLPEGNNSQVINITGIRPKIRKMLFGTGAGATGTGGIIRKLASKAPADQFDSDEKKFIAATSPGAYSLLRRLSTEINSAGLAGDRMVDIQAIELTSYFVEEMYDAIRNAVESTGRPMDSSMLQVMRDKKEQINSQRAIAHNAIAGVNTLLSLQENLIRSLREPLNHKVH